MCALWTPLECYLIDIWYQNKNNREGSIIVLVVDAKKSTAHAAFQPRGGSAISRGHFVFSCLHVDIHRILSVKPPPATIL